VENKQQYTPTHSFSIAQIALIWQGNEIYVANNKIHAVYTISTINIQLKLQQLLLGTGGGIRQLSSHRYAYVHMRAKNETYMFEGMCLPKFSRKAQKVTSIISDMYTTLNMLIFDAVVIASQSQL